LKNYKSILAIIGTILLIVAQLTLGIIQFSDSSDSNTPENDILREENIKRSKALENELIKNIPAYLITGKMSPPQKLMQLQKDSIFSVAANINVVLNEKFQLKNPSITPTIQLFATFSNYYFFYDRVEKSNKKTISDQWAHLRSKLSKRMIPTSTFSYENIKNYTFKNLNIEEKEFTILYDDIELQGFARLVATENECYFFHFISQEKKGKNFDTAFLKKQLDSYLEIK